jgi:hypothetical protein
MSMATIATAATDPNLIRRVTAAAHREMIFNQSFADSVFGTQLRAGYGNISGLMFAVAVDTEAAYETAVNAGRGAPGHDTDVITDAALSAAVSAHWPPDPEPPSAPQP